MTAPCLLTGVIGVGNARIALAEPKSPGFSNEMTFKGQRFVGLINCSSKMLSINHFRSAL